MVNNISIIELIKQIFVKENKQELVIIDDKTGKIIYNSQEKEYVAH